MLTDNYIKFKRAKFNNTKVSLKVCDGTSLACDTTRADTPDLGAYMALGRCNALVSGQSASISSSKWYNNANTYYSSFTTLLPGVYFGSGNTPASKVDYTLESPITSGLTIVSSGKTTVDMTDGAYLDSVSFIVTNTTGSDLNIYEIGLFGQCAYGAVSNYTHYGAAVLFDRTVLAEPLTISPGGSKLVTYKVSTQTELNIE